MSGETGKKDQREARRVAIVLAVLVLLLVVAGILAAPMLASINQAHIAPGMGLKEAAVLAFLATMVVLVILAVAAGDGLLGELQFMLAAFFSFFVVLWLLIAWVF